MYISFNVGILESSQGFNATIHFGNEIDPYDNLYDSNKLRWNKI